MGDQNSASKANQHALLETNNEIPLIRLWVSAWSPTGHFETWMVLNESLILVVYIHTLIGNYKLQVEFDVFCRIFIGDDTVNVEEFYSFSNFRQLGWNVGQTREVTALNSSNNRETICDICLISVFCPNIFVKL